MPSLPPNTFKAAIAAGTQQIGLWSSLCSNIATEIIAGSGFDWIVLDTEHAPNEIPGLLSQLQAMYGSPTEPVVRVRGTTRSSSSAFSISARARC